MTFAEIRRGRWSIGEIARLKELYGMRPDGAVARALGRPVPSVQKMAEQLFAGPPKTGPWSAAEVQSLKAYLGICPPERIARILRRRLAEVQRKIASLGRVRFAGPWTQEEIARLKQLYGSRNDADLARVFGRPVSSVARKAATLRLSKDKLFLRQASGQASRMPRWSREELKRLRAVYPDRSNWEVAKILNRSVKSIVSKAHDLNLKKDIHRLEEMGRQNVSLRADR